MERASVILRLTSQNVAGSALENLALDSRDGISKEATLGKDKIMP